MKTPPPAQTRLSVLLARDADTAVVFRRGPTKQVLLIRWNRADDTFDLGQWFHGRIYENRCDLSPDGERLLYFAANFHAPSYSWTAISRPPFLTALALWFKGDCWGGGGDFVTKHHVRLNHRENERELAEGFSLPKAMTVEPYGEYSGRGEDEPIHHNRLARDGWELVQEGKTTWNRHGAAVGVTVSPAEIIGKANPVEPGLRVTSTLTGYYERGGPLRMLSHAVDHGGDTLLDLGRSDWADWDSNGDLLFARDGQLYRCALEGTAFGEPRCLIDTRELRFRELAPTPEALTWNEAVVVAEKGPLE